MSRSRSLRLLRWPLSALDDMSRIEDCSAWVLELRLPPFSEGLVWLDDISRLWLSEPLVFHLSFDLLAIVFAEVLVDIGCFVRLQLYDAKLKQSRHALRGC